MLGLTVSLLGVRCVNTKRACTRLVLPGTELLQCGAQHPGTGLNQPRPHPHSVPRQCRGRRVGVAGALKSHQAQQCVWGPETLTQPHSVCCGTSEEVSTASLHEQTQASPNRPHGVPGKLLSSLGTCFSLMSGANNHAWCMGSHED